MDGSDGLGRLDAGLFFIAYQRDPATGFVQVQRNLRLDAMNEYVRHTSSAVFACPPAMRGDDDWWGRALFTTCPRPVWARGYAVQPPRRARRGGRESRPPAP